MTPRSTLFVKAAVKSKKNITNWIKCRQSLEGKYTQTPSPNLMEWTVRSQSVFVYSKKIFRDSS